MFSCKCCGHLLFGCPLCSLFCFNVVWCLTFMQTLWSSYLMAATLLSVFFLFVRLLVLYSCVKPGNCLKGYRWAFERTKSNSSCPFKGNSSIIFLFCMYIGYCNCDIFFFFFFFFLSLFFFYIITNMGECAPTLWKHFSSPEQEVLKITIY